MISLSLFDTKLQEHWVVLLFGPAAHLWLMHSAEHAALASRVEYYLVDCPSH